MAESSWLIRGGTLVDPEAGELAADLRIAGGRIAAVGIDLPTDGSRVFDARGSLVFPGFIDPHVHLGYARGVDDDAVSETISAAAGGVTTIFHFAKVLSYLPEQGSYLDVFDRLFDSINRHASVDVAFHLHLSTYEQADEIPAYAERGVTSYKYFLSYRGSKEALKRGTVGVGDGVLYAGLEQIARVPGAVAMVHCENEDLVEYFSRSVPDKEHATFLDFVRSHPGIAEAEQIRRVCYYAGLTGASVYFPHVSSREGIEAIQEYRRAGGKGVYAEICPHYLVLTGEDAAEMMGATAKTFPPVRDRANLEALWSGVSGGAFDTVGSDHAPAPLARKERVWDGAAGMPGVETIVPVMVSEGLRRGIPMAHIARLCALNAARTFGLYPRKGSLQVGADADLAIVDTGDEHPIRAADLHSSVGYTPFEGMPVRARVRSTFLRGRLIWHEGQMEATNQGEVVLRGPAR